MIEVEVLYADLTRQRKRMSELDQLSTASVLFIVVQTDQEVGNLKNIDFKQGRDHYALAMREAQGQRWLMLSGWDDGDFVWRRVTNVHDPDARHEVDAPFGGMRIVFRGQAVSAAVWEQALVIIAEILS